MDHDIERFELSVVIKSCYIKPQSGWQKSIALLHHFQNSKSIVLLILSSNCLADIFFLNEWVGQNLRLDQGQS